MYNPWRLFSCKCMNTKLSDYNKHDQKKTGKYPFYVSL